MALPTPALVPSGLLHATTQGTIDVGPGEGQVPALGPNQLMQLDITGAFSRDIRNKPGFADQFYVTSKSLDANVTDIRINAVAFLLDANGDPAILQLDVDLTAPGDVYILMEAHHSSGR